METQIINVEATQKAVNLAVLSKDEADEFFHNLVSDLGKSWSTYELKEKLSTAKKVYDAGQGLSHH